MNFFIRFGSYTLGSCVLGAAVCQTAAIKISCFADPKHWNENWDNTNSGARPVTTGVRHILLIRHGQYNTRGRGDANKTLTIHGRAQAAALGTYIGRMSASLDIPITAVTVSTMTRARQTYDIATASPDNNLHLSPVIHTSDIIEGAPHAHDPPHPNWRATENEIRQNQPRLNRAFKKHFHRPTGNADTFELFFCHANVTRYFLCKALQLPLHAWLRFNLRHCSITWLLISGDGRVTCKSYGDTGFLNQNLRTES